MMSDHWKLLANLLGTPGPVDPNPSDTSAKPAAPAASTPAASTTAPAAPARDPLAAMTEKEPDRLVPGFEIPPAPAAPEKPARRSAWDTLIGTLGIKVAEEAQPTVASTPPSPAEKRTSFADSPAAPATRSTRASSFGAGLGDDIDDEPRAKSRDEAVPPAPAKPKTGPVWRDEEPLAPARRPAPESSSKPKRTGFADGLIDWDPLGEDDSFDSDSDEESSEGAELTAEKAVGTERNDDDRSRRRGRRGRGRNRGRDRDDRDTRDVPRSDAFVGEDDLSDSRSDFDLDDDRSDVSARSETARDEITRGDAGRGESDRGDSRRRGRRGERQRMGERVPTERSSGERSSTDRAASERPAGERDAGGRRLRERGSSDRSADVRGPVDRSRPSHTSARSDFDFVDELDLEEVGDSEDRTVASDRTEREPSDRPRRRRGRRGRGGAGREGASRESERPESTASHGFRDVDDDFGDEPPFAPELAVDELEPVSSLDDDHEDHEDVEQMRRGRRRRRGGRGRGGDRSTERQGEESVAVDSPRGEDAFAATARQRNVPTWLDTVNLLVDANIERHRRSGGGSRPNHNRGPRR